MSEVIDHDGSVARTGRTPGADADFGIRSGKTHLRDYLRIVFKHRWPAAAVLVLICGLSLLYNVTRLPIYEARTQLLIDAGTENVVNFKEVVEQDKALYEYYQTQLKLLKSRSLAKRTIDSLAAWNAPELVGTSVPGGRLVRFADSLFNPAATARRWVSQLRPAETPQAAPSQADVESGVIDGFVGRISVAPVGESRLVDVKFTARDPQFAERAVNTLADQYIQQARDHKIEASQEALTWLQQKLQEQRTQVESSEIAAQRYRERNNPLPADDKQNIILQKLADLNSAVTRAKTARIVKEAQYRQLESMRGAGAENSAMLETPAIASNELIQQLRRDVAELQRQKAELQQKFGDRHPQMVKLGTALDGAQARLATEADKVIALVRNEYQGAAAEEERLGAALETQKAEALALNRVAIDYNVLERDASSNRQIFDGLLQRMKEAGITNGLRSTDVRVVDRAELPRAPLAQTRYNFLMALMFGSMVSVGLTFFLEYLDSSVKSPEEIRDHLRLPFLGMLPLYPAGDGLDSLPVVSRGQPAHFAEAFQTVRSNVLFSAPATDTHTLIVTSTQPSEGKTVVASNLAVSFGQVGMRVLLVDTDMRRPSVHKVFGLSKEHGLSDVLNGSILLSDAVQETTAHNVSVLSAGSRTDNPAALLQSAAFQRLLVQVAREFDWVILDSPPVMPVTDASIVASHAAAVLFVVGSEMTSRYAAMNALNQLEAAHAGFVGAVLNRVDVVRHSYYYSNYYKRKYTTYYQDPDGGDDPSSGRKPRKGAPRPRTPVSLKVNG